MQQILKIEGVSRLFSDGSLALKDVSFSVNSGEFIVLAGSNGSGKTVLMNLISGLDFPTQGSISLQEGVKVGLVFQDADAQILGETPEEDVSFGARNCGLKKDALKECVEKSLDSCGLLQKKDFPARQMSGGEKRRLAVAGILAMNCSLIIFDEPFANLDYEGVRQVCAILKKLKSQGKTVIVLTHELEKILALADRFLILNKGMLCFDGSVEEGLSLNLEQYSIRNPLCSYTKVEDLLWL